MSLILALDTSSPVLSLALKRNHEPAREKRAEGLRSHSEQIVLLIEELLREAGVKPAEIDIFLIGRGPGSFTGLRVGFAVVKGFLAVEKKDCYGAVSLDTIAANAALPNGADLGICLDAFRSKIYFRAYRRENSGWVPQGEAAVLSSAELGTRLTNGMALAGDGIARYRQDFENFAREKNLNVLPESAWHPRAAAMIELFLKNKNSFQKLETPADLVPLYFRLSEAEERKQHASPC